MVSAVDRVVSMGIAPLLHLQGMEKGGILSLPDLWFGPYFDLGSSRMPDKRNVRNDILRLLYRYYTERLAHRPLPSVTVILVGDPNSVSGGKVQRATKVMLEALGSQANVAVGDPAHVATGVGSGDGLASLQIG